MAVSVVPRNSICFQFHQACTDFGLKQCSRRGFFYYYTRPSFVASFQSIRSSLDSNTVDPSSSNGSSGTTRLIRAFQGIQMRLGAKIRDIRRGFAVKVLFFLAGFYCATAFATVIGQTGDWDILSAAMAVFIVEGIGALMYKASLPLFKKIRSLITVFNYWKTGLTLGLFLDSFKYKMDDVYGFANPFDFGFDLFSMFL